MGKAKKNMDIFLSIFGLRLDYDLNAILTNMDSVSVSDMNGNYVGEVYKTDKNTRVVRARSDVFGDMTCSIETRKIEGVPTTYHYNFEVTELKTTPYDTMTGEIVFYESKKNIEPNASGSISYMKDGKEKVKYDFYSEFGYYEIKHEDDLLTVEKTGRDNYSITQIRNGVNEVNVSNPKGDTFPTCKFSIYNDNLSKMLVDEGKVPSCDDKMKPLQVMYKFMDRMKFKPSTNELMETLRSLTPINMGVGTSNLFDNFLSIMLKPSSLHIDRVYTPFELEVMFWSKSLFFALYS